METALAIQRTFSAVKIALQEYRRCHRINPASIGPSLHTLGAHIPHRLMRYCCRETFIPSDDFCRRFALEQFDETFHLLGFLSLLALEIQWHAHNHNVNCFLLYNLANPPYGRLVVWKCIQGLCNDSKRVTEGDPNPPCSIVNAQYSFLKSQESLARTGTRQPKNRSTSRMPSTFLIFSTTRARWSVFFTNRMI